MGEQSSRIIWGKRKLNIVNNDPTAITLYNNNVIYVNGNYAIKDDSVTPERKRVAEDYHLYLCTAEETAGDWKSADWVIQSGVKNWYLSTSKSFKKGARVIKEDVKGEFETLKLYKCIVDKTTPNKGFIPSEWEVVLQDVGLAWEPMDHKDVYYDDGKNVEKWHKKMYLVYDYGDEKVDLDIVNYMEEWQYHYGDRCLFEHPTNGLHCYRFIHHEPYKGPWNPNYWVLEPDVLPYEVYTAYNKNDEVFKRTVVHYEIYIGPFEQLQVNFATNKYCLHVINKGRDVERLQGFHDVLYLEKIFRGEAVTGLYKAIRPTNGTFNYDDWELQASDQVIALKPPEDPDSGAASQVYTFNPNNHDIQMWSYGKSFEVDDLCIWPGIEGENNFCLNACKKQIISSTKQNCPPNKEYWIPVSQIIESPEACRVYKAIKDIPAETHSHFNHDDWIVVTQKVEPDYGLYGIIWEKYGVLGGGTNPFFFPIVITGTKYGSGGTLYQEGIVDNFIPFTAEDSTLITGFERLTKWVDNQIEYGGYNKIIAGNFYYYAYNTTSSQESHSFEKLSDADIFVSKNGMDWKQIILDGTRASKFEIFPCDDGFMYVKKISGTGTSIGNVALIKVTINNQCEKVSEDILINNLDYSHLSSSYNLFLNGYFVYYENGVYNSINEYGEQSTFEGFPFTRKDGKRLYAIKWDEYTDFYSEPATKTVTGTLTTIDGSVKREILFYSQTTPLPDVPPVELVNNKPYAYDDKNAYMAYFIHGVSTYIMRLYRLNLDTGEFTNVLPFEAEEPDLSHMGLVNNIPYYNHDTCHLSRLNTYVRTLTLQNKQISEYQTSARIENGNLHITFDATKYYNIAHGATYSGTPSNTCDLFISDDYEITVVGTGASRVYHVCVYVPSYYGDNLGGNGTEFSSAGSFFWLFSNEDSGGPFYGGPGGGGF